MNPRSDHPFIDRTCCKECSCCVSNQIRQMQQIITKKIVNYGFYLVNATPSRSTVIRRDNRSDRVVIGGKNNLAFKPYFKVTYVKYPYDK